MTAQAYEILNFLKRGPATARDIAKGLVGREDGGYVAKQLKVLLAQGKIKCGVLAVVRSGKNREVKEYSLV